MSLSDHLFGTYDSESDTPEERPPKPDPETDTDTETFDLYEISVEYHSGETETFRTHSYDFGERVLSVGTGAPTYHIDWHAGPWMRENESALDTYRHPVWQEYPDEVSIPYEVLATRSHVQQVGETVVEYDCTVHYTYRNGDWVQGGDYWCEITDTETTLDSDTAQEADE